MRPFLLSPSSSKNILLPTARYNISPYSTVNQFGSLVLNMLTVRAILLYFLTVIMLPLARLGFKKHQVTMRYSMKKKK